MGSGYARVAGWGGGDAVCAGGGCSARRAEHGRTGCGEHGVGSGTWTACVLSDMEALNIGGVVALEREANNRESFRKLTSAYTQI